MHQQRVVIAEGRAARRWPWVAAVLLLALASFIAGYKLRARLNVETLQTVWAKYVLGQPSHKHDPSEPVIRETLLNDYGRLIAIRSAEEVDVRRRQAIAHIWRGKAVGFEALRPDLIERDVFFLPLVDLELRSIDRLTVRMPFAVESVVFHLKPRHSRSCLMLYQEGHRDSFLQRKRFLKRVVDEGCDVLALSFPLTGGINNRPEVDHPRFGRMLLNDPDDLQFLDSEDASYLHYFVAPMVAALNHVLAENRFERVGATGFSGGGWAVELLAALDPRIQASYAVAGSAPIGFHAARPGWGSPEQRDGRFYNLVTYTELYVMGATGTGRRQRQFFNLTDPCCFSGTSWAGYQTAVADRAQTLGGDFRIYAYQADEHRLTKPVALAIVDDFLNGGANLPPGITATR